MHILFIDESGSPPHPPKGHADLGYFVIGGIALHEGAWHRVKNNLMGMKARFQIRGELKWRYFAPGNSDESNPVRLKSQQQRDIIRDEFFNIIKNEDQLTCICCITDCNRAYELEIIESQEDIYHYTYKPVTERFQYFLQDFSRKFGSKENGIIICDHRSTRDDMRLKQHHSKLINSSSEFISQYNNLIEGLLFQQSNLSVGIQIADMVAGAVWRKYQKNDSRWFDVIEPRFRRSPSGNTAGHGLVHFPSRKRDAG
jgi:hypothetical protein